MIGLNSVDFTATFGVRKASFDGNWGEYCIPLSLRTAGVWG
jgi:hypothetical protein